MKKRLVYIMLATVVVSSLLTGCGKEATKETSSTTVEASSNEEETGTSETTDDATSESETTTETPSTTVKPEETTTKKEEATTTKKQEITTTKKQEETTTKKQETTTAKQEETTTKKEEETTTQAPIPEEPKTWFEQKGYTITEKSLASTLGNLTTPAHECTCTVEINEYEDSWYKDGYKQIEGWISLWCETCKSPTIEAFDRNTGMIYSVYKQSGKWNDEGFYEVQANIDGKSTTIYVEIGKGGAYVIGVHCPKEYDGVVFLWGNSDDITDVSGFGYGVDESVTTIYKLDEIYDFDAKDVYFLSVDDK